VKSLPTCDDCTGRFGCTWPERKTGGPCTGFVRAPLPPAVKRAFAAFRRYVKVRREYETAMIALAPHVEVPEGLCGLATKAGLAEGKLLRAIARAEGKARG